MPRRERLKATEIFEERGGSMGRPAKAIGAADGARTKEEIETRKQTEEKLKGGDKPKVTCPGYLTPSQRKIFNKIKKLLVDAGAAGSCDGWVIAFCAVAIDRVAEIDADANRTIVRRTDKDIVAARSKYMADFYRCCNELCLSPQARAKLGVAAAKAKAKEKDPLLAILQDDDG